MARALLREGQMGDRDNLSEPEHEVLVHENLVTSGTLNFQDGTISGTGDVYATTYYGDGSQLTGVGGGATDKIEEGDSSVEVIDAGGAATIVGTVDSETAFVATANGSVDLYYDGTKTFETSAAGATLVGTLTADGLTMAANEYITLAGNSRIYDSGTEITFRNAAGTENLAKFAPNGECKLYFDNTPTLYTAAYGIVAQDGSGDDPKILFRSSTGTTVGRIGWDDSLFSLLIGSSSETALTATTDGAVALHYDGTKVFNTTDTGIEVGNGTDIADFEMTSGNFEIKNTHDGGIFSLKRMHTASVERVVMVASDSGVEIYDNAQNVALATSSVGIKTTSAAGYHAQLRFDGTQLNLTSYQHGGNIGLRNEDAGGVMQDLFIGDPDGAVELYYDGSKVFETKSDGIQLTSSPSYIYNIDGEALMTLTSTTTSIGYNGTAIAVAGNTGWRPEIDDTYDLGHSSYHWDDIYATNNVIQTSDERIKTTISGSDLGLAFINDLNPVSYKFQDHDYEYDIVSTSGIETVSGTKTFHRTHYGMIAQDVEATLSGIGKDTEDFAGFIHDQETDTYGLRYGEFIAPTIKAIQELSAIITEQQATISGLEARIEALEQ